MKKMKWMLLILCMAVLVSCGKEAPAPVEEVPEAKTELVEEHVHEAETWERNLSEHWQICGCGEAFGLEAHDLGDDVVCTVCGSEIWDFGDGTGSVCDYDEAGECIRWTEYDVDGNVTFDERSEIEYDADGNKVYNPSALPWQRNNFNAAFEMRSANGNFGIKVEVHGGRNNPY